MSPAAAHAFYKAYAKPLAADYFCIEYQRGRGDLSAGWVVRMLQSIGIAKTPLQKTVCDEDDEFQIHYDREAKALFYFYIFHFGTPATIQESTSLQTFLRHVGQFKDVAGRDYVFVALSATNLKDYQFGEIWAVDKGAASHPVKWDEASMVPRLEELDALSRKYYFSIVDKHLSRDAASGTYLADDDAIDAEFQKQGALDKALLDAVLAR